MQEEGDELDQLHRGQVPEKHEQLHTKKNHLKQCYFYKTIILKKYEY